MLASTDLLHEDVAPTKSTKLIQKLGFWEFQFLGWLLYSLFVFWVTIEPELTAQNASASLAHLGIEVVSGFILTTLLRIITKAAYSNPHDRQDGRFVVLAIALGVPVALLWNLSKLMIFGLVNYGDPFAWSFAMFNNWLLFTMATVMAWLALYFSLISVRALSEEHERAELAVAMAEEAQLKMLRYQLNPHFMFNSLNALSTLILKEENNKALDMLDHISTFLRITLEKKVEQIQPLSTELEQLKLYLNIEKARFGNRLSTLITAPPDLMNYHVPSLILQTFVENSVKHAISGMKTGGKIHITAVNLGSEIALVVDDNGTGTSCEKSPSTGIGFKNSQKRLEAMYGKRASIETMESPLGGLRVRITIPMEWETA